MTLPCPLCTHPLTAHCDPRGCNVGSCACIVAGIVVPSQLHLFQSRKVNNKKGGKRYVAD